MVRFLILLALANSFGVHAQSVPREEEQYEILNMLIKERNIVDLFAEVANGNLLSYTDTLQRFRGWKLDSSITIDKVQRQDFINQLINSKIRTWDSNRVNAKLEAEKFRNVIGASIGNNFILPDRYSRFFNRDVSVFEASIPIFSIDRKTAYISLSNDRALFKGNKFDDVGPSLAGIYIMEKKDGNWTIVNYILVMGGS